MSRIVKRIAKIAVLGLLVVLLIGGLLGPRLASGLVKSKVVALLSEKVDGSVTIDGLSLGWLSGVSLRGLVVEDPESGAPALTVTKATAHPEILRLIGGDIIVRGVEIEGVDVHAVRRDGEWNLARILVPSDGGEAPPAKPRRGRPGSMPQTRNPTEVPPLRIDATVRDVTVRLDEGDGAEPVTIRAIDRMEVDVKTGEPIRIDLAGLDGVTIDGTLDLFDGATLRDELTRSGSFEVRASDRDLEWLLALLPSSLRSQFVNEDDGTPRVAFERADLDHTVTLEGSSLRVAGTAGLSDVVLAAARAAFEEGESAEDGSEGDDSASREPAAPREIDALTLTVDLAIALGEDPWPTGDVRLSTGEALVPMEGGSEPLRVDSVAAHVVLGERKQIRLKSSRIESDVLVAEVTGALSLFGESPSGTANVQGSLELGTLSKAMAAIPESGGEVELEATLLTGDADGRFELRGTVRSEAVETRAGEATIRDGNVDLQYVLMFDPAEMWIGIDRVTWTSDLLTLRTEGGEFRSIDDFDNMAGVVKIAAETELAPIREMLPEVLPRALRGRTTVRGELWSGVGKKAVDLSFTGTGLALEDAEGQPLELGDASAKATMSVEGRELDVLELTAETSAASVTAKGKLTGRKEALPRGELAITARASIEPLRAMLPTAPIPEGLAGIFTVEGTAKSTKKVALDLGVMGSRVRLAVDDEADKTLATRVRGTVDPETLAIDCPQVPFSIDGMKGTASVRMTPGEDLALAGRFDLGLESLRDAFAVYAPDGITATGDGTMTFEVSLPLAEESTPSDLVVDATLAVERLEVADCVLDGASLELGVADGVAEVRNGKARVNGGATTFGGQLQYAATPRVVFAELDAKGVGVSGETQGILARVIPLFAGIGVVVEAATDLDVELTAQGADVEAMKRSLRGGGTIAVRQGTIRGNSRLTRILSDLGEEGDFEFEEFASRFTIMDGAVLQDPFAIRARQAELRLSGVVAFDGRLDYAIDVKPLGQSARNVRRYARILDPDGYIPFGLGGTLASPAVRVPSPEDVVENVLDGLLDRGVDRLLRDRDRDEERDKERRKKPKANPNKKKKNDKKKEDQEKKKKKKKDKDG